MKTKMTKTTNITTRRRKTGTATTTMNLVVIAVGLIAILAVGTLTTTIMLSGHTAKAESDHSSDQSKQGKDLRCDKDERGSGNPHDKENPQNPHDTQLGFYRGNPHDECIGS